MKNILRTIAFLSSLPYPPFLPCCSTYEMLWQKSQFLLIPDGPLKAPPPSLPSLVRMVRLPASPPSSTSRIISSASPPRHRLPSPSPLSSCSRRQLAVGRVETLSSSQYSFIPLPPHDPLRASASRGLTQSCLSHLHAVPLPPSGRSKKALVLTPVLSLRVSLLLLTSNIFPLLKTHVS